MAIRIVVDGIGIVGSQFVCEAAKKNIRIVGAVDNSAKKIGCDLGEYLGIGKMDILITKNLDEVLKREKPDLVVLCTRTNISDIIEDIETCILNRVNILTSSEECYLWKITNKELGIYIDMLAKKHGVTICAGGVQDMNWNIIPSALSAMCHNISRIEGVTLATIDNFGPVVMEEAYVGLTIEEFRTKVAKIEDVPFDAFTISLYALAERLNLHVKSKKISFKPVIARKEMFCKPLDIFIPIGDLIGSETITELETTEGIVLSCSFISKLAEETDSAYNKWNIVGNPNLSLILNDMHGDITTTSCMINRIPDILNAKAGFITVNDLPVPCYKTLVTNNNE